MAKLPVKIRPHIPETSPDFRWSDRRIWLSGVVQDKAQAQEVIDFVTAMMGFLPEPAEAPCDRSADEKNEKLEGK